MESCDIAQPLSEDGQAPSNRRGLLWHLRFRCMRCSPWRRYIPVLCLSLCFLFVMSLWLSSSGPVPVVPVAPTNATNTSTTTTSTTTAGCQGADVSKLTGAAACFCLYGGRCLEHFHCGASLPSCQESHCGEQTLERTASTASFYNIRHKTDVLSIPVESFRDIKRLADACPFDALEQMTALVSAGRRVFQKFIGGAPVWQCVHLYPYVSVPWLHLHTFRGSVPEEHLPNSPPHAACVAAEGTAGEAAAALLALAR
ncbi:unnamed protein product [Durusdinium trenchii]|uniref:Uncharacterized protein n=2 Tax=Durusdinium trenchii TaxID=1381693 RepID=A0ABP0QYD1_9DINO